MRVRRYYVSSTNAASSICGFYCNHKSKRRPRETSAIKDRAVQHPSRREPVGSCSSQGHNNHQIARFIVIADDTEAAETGSVAGSVVNIALATLHCSVCSPLSSKQKYLISYLMDRCEIRCSESQSLEDELEYL